jgi:K+-transporting ATPase ATPase C chain
MLDTRLAPLVDANMKTPILGIFGEPRVNVLGLNRALDALPPGTT